MPCWGQGPDGGMDRLAGEHREATVTQTSGAYRQGMQSSITEPEASAEARWAAAAAEDHAGRRGAAKTEAAVRTG